jgi:signal transduction histidine kinase
LLAESGVRGAVEQRFSITNAGSVIGSLDVSPRSGERALGSRDREIIEDLCRQSGPALASLQLTEDLQRSRERLVTAREEERRRLRRDLHDGIGPRLAGLALRVETARDLAEDSPELRGKLDDLAERLQDTVADIRRLVYGLRPPALDDLGLVAALRQTIEHYDPGGVRMTFEAGDLPRLSAAVEVATYRIVQEALTNVVKHAPGAACNVTLRHEPEASELVITVSDSGPGTSGDTQPGIGLNSMRERSEELGGSFRFTSRLSAGSEMVATLPLLLSEEA